MKEFLIKLNQWCSKHRRSLFVLFIAATLSYALSAAIAGTYFLHPQNYIPEVLVPLLASAAAVFLLAASLQKTVPQRWLFLFKLNPSVYLFLATVTAFATRFFGSGNRSMYHFGSISFPSEYLTFPLFIYGLALLTRSNDAYSKRTYHISIAASALTLFAISIQPSFWSFLFAVSTLCLFTALSGRKKTAAAIPFVILILAASLGLLDSYRIYRLTAVLMPILQISNDISGMGFHSFAAFKTIQMSPLISFNPLETGEMIRNVPAYFDTAGALYASLFGKVSILWMFFVPFAVVWFHGQAVRSICDPLRKNFLRGLTLLLLLNLVCTNCITVGIFSPTGLPFGVWFTLNTMGSLFLALWVGLIYRGLRHEPTQSASKAHTRVLRVLAVFTCIELLFAVYLFHFDTRLSARELPDRFAEKKVSAPKEYTPVIDTLSVGIAHQSFTEMNDSVICSKDGWSILYRTIDEVHRDGISPYSLGGLWLSGPNGYSYRIGKGYLGAAKIDSVHQFSSTLSGVYYEHGAGYRGCKEQLMLLWNSSTLQCVAEFRMALIVPLDSARFDTLNSELYLDTAKQFIHFNACTYGESEEGVNSAYGEVIHYSNDRQRDTVSSSW